MVKLWHQLDPLYTPVLLCFIQEFGTDSLALSVEGRFGAAGQFDLEVIVLNSRVNVAQRLRFLRSVGL